MSKQRLHLILAAVATVALGAAIACGGGASPTAEPTGSTVVAATASVDSQADAIINALSPSNPTSLDGAETLVKSGRSVAPKVLALIESPDLVKRWAGLYYASRLAEVGDIPQVAKGLDDANLSNRAVAAATLLRLGDRRGIAVLQEAARSDEQLIFSEPPQLLSEYAQQVLQALAPNSAVDPSEATGSQKVLAKPLERPVEDVVAEVTDCHFNITLNLQFHGDGARQDLINTWVAAIRRVWSGKLSRNCCDVVLTINTKLGGAVDPIYAQINVVHVPPGGQHRSNMTLGSSGVKDDIVGDWDDLDSGEAIAHEVGHAMGQDDEYQDAPGGGVEPTGDAVGEANQAGVEPSIMAQTWNNRNGDRPGAKIRHIENIMEAYGASCPAECVAAWTARNQTPTTGVQVATPSPTPSPTPTPGVTVTATPTRAPTPTPTPTLTPRPTTYTLTFVHTVPGVQSEVYLDLVGAPGVQVTATLTRPAGGVISQAQVTGTIGSDGKLRLRWVINQFGSYTVSGSAGSTQISGQVTVQ